MQSVERLKNYDGTAKFTFIQNETAARDRHLRL